MWKKLINLYNTNQTFHSFISGAEGAVVGALVSFGTGMPTTKAGWITLAAFVGKAIYGFILRWLQNNVATQGVPTKAQLPPNPPGVH